MWERLFALSPDGDGGGGAAGGDGGAAAGAAGQDGDAGAAAGGDQGGKGADGGDGKSAAGAWPGDWRQRMAGGDEKVLAQLQRYQSPEAVWQKARALEQRMTSGELRASLPKNATAEQLAEFRKSNGIPEKGDGYDIKSIAIDEADKPLISHVLAAAHGAHATPDQVKAIVGIWPKLKAEAAAKAHEADVKAARDGEDALRAEWGAEYRRNHSLIQQLLDSTGDAKLKDNVLNGRLADGTPIGSSPAALKMLLGVALQVNPQALVLPGSGGDPAAGMNDRIAEIEKMMRTNRKAYDGNEKVQEEYRGLLRAREALGGRKAA